MRWCITVGCWYLADVCTYAELGTRPGLSGQTLVSTGLAEFDKLLGGGLPLKTVTLLLEDSYTQHHITLLKYFLAEGAANKQALHWSAGHDRHSSGAKTLPQQVTHLPKVSTTLTSSPWSQCWFNAVTDFWTCTTRRM